MKMINYILSLLILCMIPFPVSGANTNGKILEIVSTKFPQTKWDAETIVSSDINCDGEIDFAIIGIENNKVRLTLVLGLIKKSSKTVTLEFGLGDSMSQSSMCGDEPKLELESQEYDLDEALGGNPEGYMKSKKCKGLNIYDGMCDSFHIYWNHNTNTLDWWRL